MNIEIIKADSTNALKANEFLTKLIQDEKQYDPNINEKFSVSSFYEIVVENPNNCLLIAKNKDDIVGYLYGNIIDDGGTLINNVSKLDAMFITESNRGLKIGSKLIEEFKKWSLEKGCKNIELEVFNSNITAYKFYQKNGFKDIKTVMSFDLKQDE